MLEKNTTLEDKTDTDNTFRYGGDTINTAVYLSRLSDLSTLSVSYATALGFDDNSTMLIQAWKNEGVDTTYVKQIENKKPGSYTIATKNSGERSFTYQRNESAVKNYFSDDFENNVLIKALDNNVPDYIYLSGISLAILNNSDRESLLLSIAKFQLNGGVVIFDNNFRPALWHVDPIPVYEKITSISDILLLTDEDEYAIYQTPHNVKSIIDRYIAFDRNVEFVIKRGKQPTVVGQSQRPESLFVISTERVEAPKDTTAAGDSFAAGYLSQRLLGRSIKESVEAGHKLAAKVIQEFGAIVPISTV